MTARRILFILLAIVTTCGMSCGPSLVEVLIECPSPDRKLFAVVWAEVVGVGASAQELVSIRPGDVPMARQQDRRGGELSPVLTVNSAASAFALRWEGNHRLLITVTYPDRATVSQIAERRTIRGRPVDVAYQEVKIDRPFMTTKAACESDGRRIEDPLPRRLR
jgi:hypothetical protein